MENEISLELELEFQDEILLDAHVWAGWLSRALEGVQDESFDFYTLVVDLDRFLIILEGLEDDSILEAQLELVGKFKLLPVDHKGVVLREVVPYPVYSPLRAEYRTSSGNALHIKGDSQLSLIQTQKSLEHIFDPGNSVSSSDDLDLIDLKSSLLLLLQIVQ